MTATATRSSAPPTPVQVRPTAPRQRAALEPAGTIALALLTVVTAVGFCRLFPDWSFLRQMVAVIVGVHAAAAVLRFVRVPVWLAVPITAVIAFELLAIVYYRDTTTFLLPTSQTLDFMRADFRLVWQQFPSAVAPVPSEGSFAMAAAALLAACAILADTFAFRAFGRAEAAVPAGVVFVFTSALGTDRDRIAVSALWVGAAIVVIAMLRFSHNRDESAWMGTRRRTLSSVLPAALVCAGIAALAAGVVAPRLPGANSSALFDTRNRGNDVTEVLNPLVDIRSKLVNRRNVEVFDVVAPAVPNGAYWREIGLDTFDGTTWQPSNNESLRPASDQLADASGGTAVEQTITIKRLGGKLIPTAFAPVVADTAGLFYADATQSLVKPDPGLQSGEVITLTSVINHPSPDVLRAATVANAPESILYDLPSDFPAEAADLARQVTASATTPYDKAIALQDYFRNNFEYSLDVQSGHSDDAIRQFLRIRKGYCEQFAGTFAALGRVVGLPTRVAIGFTPGDKDANGVFHVFDRHAHAWAEVWFDGIGWISFDPTPGRGEPGAEGYTGVAAQQDNGGSTGGGNGNGGAPPTTSGAALGTAPRITAEPNGPVLGAATTTVPVIAGGSGDSDSSMGGGVLVAVVLAALAAWALFMPRIARAWRRGGSHAPPDRVAASWRRAVGVMRLAGAPAVGGATPLEYARTAQASTGIDVHLLGELARTVTRAAYSPAGVDDAAAVRSEQLEHQIGELCHPKIPLTTRILSRLDPRVARQTS